MALTQLLMAIYLMFFSYFNQEITYNIAYFIKMISYFIPFSCLLINYAFSYKTILKIKDELQISQEKLKYLAAHDELTHLYNRREFENLLDKTIANYAREHRSFAVLMIDIDDFKSINDSFGHTHGDHYLKHFSEQLSLLTRKGDIIARLGGDEFSIIMPQLNSPASARQLARRIIKGLSMPYTGNQELLSRTVSIGIAIYPCHGITSNDLLKNADLAMYHAKKSGKNSYQFPKDPQAENLDKPPEALIKISQIMPP
jgi:diguanylate cyclase (GGDEF)-like protein